MSPRTAVVVALGLSLGGACATEGGGPVDVTEGASGGSVDVDGAGGDQETVGPPDETDASTDSDGRPPPFVAPPTCEGPHLVVTPPSAVVAEADEGGLDVSACAPTGTKLYYTLDGSPPTVADGLPWSEPLRAEAPPGRAAVILRVASFVGSVAQGDVETRTWIFPSAAATQSAEPAGFPARWGQAGGKQVAGDYAMDPDVAEDPAYRDTLQDTLRALPTLAIIAEHAALWSEETGIYMNPSKSGSDWERGGTAIYLPGDTGGDGFTIDCGLRMQGGTSVLGWKTHKLSLRLLFKAAWGPSKLAYPLYPGSPVDKFDTLVADAHLNHTWHHPWQDQQESADYARDRFLADQMLAIGSLAPRGRFVHFYLNGLYWGLYELHERPDDSFCAEHLGGDKDEWDVIKHDSSQVVAGDPTAWDEMMDVVRSQLGGDDKLAALQQHLDVAAFIDYQLVNFWAGNTDWPHHNWYGARHRSEAGRWQFFSWDAEHVLEGLDDNESDNFHEDSPGELWGALLESEAFREQVTARAEQLFNGGDGFAPDQIYFQAAASIRDAVVAESARWGDLRRPDQAYTRDVEWETEQTRLAEQYFPHRTARVIEHLEALDIEVELDDEP